MKKIIFIVPFFGKLPEYFPLWLKSCEYNKNINWVILTDDTRDFGYPENVTVKYSKFKQIKEKFKSKFGDDIVLTKPYQLCEFRVSFGYVFEDLIDGFDFWGYCDIDVIWGDLRKFFTNEILENYDKLGWRGHLTLFKNDKENNSIFKKTVNGINWWDIASKNTTNFPLAFDEGGISYYFEVSGKRTFSDFPFADLKIRSNNFSCMHVENEISNSIEVPMIFYWDGNLLRYSECDGNLVCHEFAYIHFLKRPMKIDPEFYSLNSQFLKPYWIVPNMFLPKENINLDINAVRQYSKKRIYWNYIFSRLNLGYIKSKFKHYESKANFKKRYGWFNFETPNYSFKLRDSKLDLP